MLPSASTKVGWQNPLLPASSTALLTPWITVLRTHRHHISRIFIQVLWLHSTVSYYTGQSHKSAVCPAPPCHCRQWMHHVGALLISILWCNTLWIWAEAVITAMVLIRCCVGTAMLPWNSLFRHEDGSIQMCIYRTDHTGLFFSFDFRIRLEE